jgi:acyl-CoA synthetase (AMP-forming)/AMP-acid ligase II
VAIPTLGNILRPHARERGGHIALHGDGRATTYRELELRANRVANALLRLGIQPGDRVAYLGKNSVAYFEVLIGAAKARAVMTPLNWRLAPPELEYLLSDCKPRVLFVGAGFEAVAVAAGVAPDTRRIELGADSYERWLREVEDRDPELRCDPSEATLQLYTSGTTGKPKGAVLTHTSLFGLRAAMREPEWYRWSTEDVSLVAMPVAHVSGTGWAIWTLSHGAKGVVVAEFDPHSVLDVMTEHRISKVILVPTAIQIVLRHPRAASTDFSFLRTICYGGSPMPPDLLREAMQVFRCNFVQMYGMTETAGTIVALPPEDHDPANPRLSSVGVPLPGVEVAVRSASGEQLGAGEVGEIVTRSVANMSGYYRQPDATAATIDADGWLHTGDVGYVDERGYVYVRDRLKDMIISGGENVYPAEVEAALRGHPAIAEVAVIGLPDAKWGEAVCAVIVPQADAAPELDSVVAWARERIAGYKCPKHLRIVAALPRNATGKVLRRELRDQFSRST